MKAWLRAAFVDNAAIKFVSMVLAVTIFILVNTGQDVDIGVTVPVRYTMPKDKVLVSERIDQVRLSIRGSWRRTKRFDDREIEPIHIDLSERGDGLLLFQEDMVRLPHGLELLSIAPTSAPVRFEPLVSRSVPIAQPHSVGSPASGFHLAGIRLEQPTVTVRGAQSAVAKVQSVTTIEIAIDGRSESYSTTADLATPPGVELADQVVAVRVIIEPDEGTRREQMKVAVRPLFGAGDLGDRFAIDPPVVEVTLHGTRERIEAALAAGVEAYVKVSPDDPAGRPVEVLVRASGVGHEVLPREVTVVRRSRP